MLELLVTLLQTWFDEGDQVAAAMARDLITIEFGGFVPDGVYAVPLYPLVSHDQLDGFTPARDWRVDYVDAAAVSVSIDGGVWAFWPEDKVVFHC